MNNSAKYAETFARVFELPVEQVGGLTYQSIPAWDSVGHMALVSGLEEAFDIMLNTEDIIDLNSFAAGKQILEKYGVQF